MKATSHSPRARLPNGISRVVAGAFERMNTIIKAIIARCLRGLAALAPVLAVLRAIM